MQTSTVQTKAVIARAPSRLSSAADRAEHIVQHLGLTPDLARFTLTLFALTRAGYVALTLVIMHLPIRNPPATFVQAWYRYDATYYAGIASTGYQPGPLAHFANFFPLQPLLALLASPLTGGDTVVSSLLVANVCCLIAMLGLATLTMGLWGEQTARYATLFFALYPGAFFLFAGYSEAAFLATAIWSVVAMRHGRWWLAGLLGLFAALARNAGVLLVLPFAVEYLSQRGWRLHRIRLDALWVLLIPCGLLIFMGWLYVAMGDPLAFVRTQSANFHHTPSPPWATVWNAFPALSLAPDRIFLVRDSIDLVCVLGFAALIVLGARHLPPSLTLYSAVAWLLPTSYRMPLWPLEAGTRYMLALFPCFIVLAHLTERRPRLRVALLVASTIALVTLAQYFARGSVIV